LTEQDILFTYYKTETIRFKGLNFERYFDPEDLVGRRNSQDIKDANGEVIYKAGHKFSKAIIRRIIKAGITKMDIHYEDIADTFLQRTLHQKMENL